MTKTPDAGARVPSLVENDTSVNKAHGANPASAKDVEDDSEPKGRPTSDRHHTETGPDTPMNGVTGTRTPKNP